LIASAAVLAAATPGLVFGPGAAGVLTCGVAFGVAGAVFYTALQTICLTLRPGQAGSTGAVISAIGLASVGFPLLAGAVADRFGLSTALWLYAAVPVIVLLLVAIFRRWMPKAPA
jgi:hypothetical protein